MHNIKLWHKYGMILSHYSYRYMPPTSRVFVLYRKVDPSKYRCMTNMVLFTTPFVTVKNEMHNILIGFREDDAAYAHAKQLNAEVMQCEVRDIVDMSTLLRVPAAVISTAYADPDDHTLMHYEIYYKDGSRSPSTLFQSFDTE